MAEHPEEKPNSNGLFGLCAGALIGLVHGIFFWLAYLGIKNKCDKESAEC